MSDPLHARDRDPLHGLSEAQRTRAADSEALWRRAHDIARHHPTVDAGDVFHALQCLQLEPAERLRRSLSRGRLRAHAR